MQCKYCNQDRLILDFPKYSKKCRYCKAREAVVFRQTPRGQQYHKKYREQNALKIKTYYRDWYAKNGRSDIDHEAILRWKMNNPEAVRAHRLVSEAVKNGTLIKPNICTLCNKKTKLNAHHVDYSNPLSVMWLCTSCHRTLHNALT